MMLLYQTLLKVVRGRKKQHYNFIQNDLDLQLTVLIVNLNKQSKVSLNPPSQTKSYLIFRPLELLQTIEGKGLCVEKRCVNKVRLG